MVRKNLKLVAVAWLSMSFGALLFAQKIDDFHVGEYSIVLDATACVGEFVGPEGEFVTVSGFSVLHSFIDDIRTSTHSVQVSSPDGLGYCIDVPTTETCGMECRYMASGLDVVNYQPTSFVVQNEGRGCADGKGDPENGANLDPVTGEPRRGFIDISFYSHPIEIPLPKGKRRILPFAIDVIIPPVGETRTLEVGFTDGLRGPGEPHINAVTFKAASVGFDRENGPDGRYITNVGCSLSIRATESERFIRCDSNDDSRVNLADSIWTLNDLFRRGPASACRAAADCDDDGSVQISDILYNLEYQFLGAAPPLWPYPNCGYGVGVSAGDCPVGSTQNCPTAGNENPWPGGLPPF